MLSVIKRSTILLIPFLLSSLCQGQLILGGGGGGGGGGSVTNIATGCGLTGGAITTTGTISEQILTAAHNGTYAILTGDCGKSLTTNTAAAWTVAQAGTTGLEAGKFWIVQNIGSGSLTVTATTSTFYGGATANISGSVLTVPANTGVEIISDGTNYQVFAGSGGSGGAGTLVFQNAGVTTGTASIFNEVNGTGVTCVDTVTAGTNVHQCSGDPAVLAFKTNIQSGASQTITTTSSSGTTYTGTMAPSLTVYTKDSVLTWDVGTTAFSGGATTLNIDTLGAKSVFRADGSSNPLAGDGPANQILRIAYDGSGFRIITAGASGGGSGTVTSIATTSPITGGTITTTGTIACATCGVTGSPLSQFAATTSVQLAGVLSDETGTGVAVFSASPTLTGTPAAPTQTAGDNTTAVATDAFVTTAVANAVAAANPATSVLAASTASLTGTYSNGASGIGATFTVTATGVFSLDGTAINTIGQRVLLKNQSSAFQNGVYTATIVGAVAVSPIFTRALDYDQPSDINNTGAIFVQTGTANILTSWLLTSTVTTVGTDALNFSQSSSNPSNLVTASSPGVGLCHFAGSTQACTSSAVVNADITAATIDLTTKVTGVLPTANGGTGSAVTAGILWPFGSPGIDSSAGVSTTPMGGTNVTQFYEVIIPPPGIVVNNLSAYTFTAVPGHVAWAFYNSACTLVATSNTVSASSGTATNWTFSSVTLNGGKYFIALTSDATTTQVYGPHSSYVSDLSTLNESAPTAHYFTGSASTGTTTLAFPGTCGTRTALSITSGTTSVPAIVLH